MLDQPVVQRHLLNLERTVSALRQLQGVTVDELERSLEKRWAVEHGLHVDLARVHQMLHAHLQDFETFAQHIRRYLDRQAE